MSLLTREEAYRLADELAQLADIEPHRALLDRVATAAQAGLDIEYEDALALLLLEHGRFGDRSSVAGGCLPGPATSLRGEHVLAALVQSNAEAADLRAELETRHPHAARRVPRLQERIETSATCPRECDGALVAARFAQAVRLNAVSQLRAGEGVRHG